MRVNPNSIVQLGLFILFITIAIGLFLIIRNLNNTSNKLTSTFEKQNEFVIQLNILTNLELEKEKLNEADENFRRDIEKKVIEFLNEFGIINKDGNPTSILGSIPHDKVSFGSYVLIFGFVFGGLLIAFAEKILYCFSK
jgi:hypothetical protein